MKIFKTLLLVTIIGSLIVCTGCPETPVGVPDHSLMGVWEVTANSDVTPSDGIEDFEKGDWVGFAIIIGSADSQTDFSIGNMPEGFEALWPLLSGDCDITDSDISFSTSSVDVSNGGVPLVEFEATYELETIEQNEDLIEQLTIIRTTASRTTGRIDGLQDPWEFVLTKKQ